MTTQNSYIGKGSVYLRKRGSATAKRLPVGNVTELNVAIEDETKELLDYQSAGGGTLDKISRIKGVTASAKTSNLDAANLALALRGTAVAAAGAPVVDELHADIQLGTLVLTNRLIDTAVAVVVKVGAATIPATDYEVRRSGVWIKEDAGTLLAMDDILVSYTAVADTLLQGLVASGDEYELVFDGLNEARSGKATLVTAHRCTISPTKSLSLIGDEFAELELEFTLLADESITGLGLSKYMTVRMAT